MITAEGMRPRVGFPHNNVENATEFFVARLFTDAIFNGDIRAMQTIIQRIDGGLPKDVDVANVKTAFGDCVNEILDGPIDDRMKVHPSDTVLMAMAKSLYAESVRDIYWNEKQKKPIPKPSTEAKQCKDAARRMILERTCGRRTLTAKEKNEETVEIASWIKELGSGSV